jgi:hypothetical protein
MPKFKDLSGQTFKNLLAVKYLGQKSNNSNYLCKCLLCGEYIEVRLDHLRKQNGCKACAGKANIVDMVGRKYGRLTVLSYAHTINRKTYWNCVCDCGNTYLARNCHLTSGNTKSCGCLGVESRHVRRFRGRTPESPEYRTWCYMKTRCYNPNTNCSKYYIEKGIKVCDRWLHSYENFLEDMGARPSPKHSIDRIDGNKNYEPSNCRWATAREQMNNVSSNILITINGETKTPRQWSDITGINCNVIYGRIKAGWNPERAITEKSRGMKPYINIHNNQYTKCSNINNL